MIGILRIYAPLEVRNQYMPVMAGYVFCEFVAFVIIAHTVYGFQGILRAYKPPYFINAKLIKRVFADV